MRGLRGLSPKGVGLRVFIISKFVLVAFLICTIPVLADCIKREHPSCDSCWIHLRVIYIETIFGDVCFRSVKGIVISNSAVIIMPICSVPYELKFFCCDFEGGCDCREGDLRTEDIFLGTDDNFLQFVHPVVEEAFRVQGSYVGWQGSYRMLVSPTPNNGVRIWIDYDKFKIFCWSIAAINNYGSEAHTLNCALLIASNILAQPTDYHKGTVSNLKIVGWERATFEGEAYCVDGADAASSRSFDDGSQVCVEGGAHSLRKPLVIFR